MSKVDSVPSALAMTAPVPKYSFAFRRRLWSVRHAAGLAWLYQKLEAFFVRFAPWLERLGYARLEKPVAWIEQHSKGLAFGCQMCGECVLSETGMSCPMNCPKQIRNGPCGGVRANGNCEVDPTMPCVWVQAYAGAQRMPDGLEKLQIVQFAPDRRLQGRSSWLMAVQAKAKATVFQSPAQSQGQVHTHDG